MLLSQRLYSVMLLYSEVTGRDHSVPTLPLVLSQIEFFLFQVNAISFHPVHGTLATVGSDGRFSFWDKDARTKLKTSEQLDQPITACCFNNTGNIFAYASSYDWSKVKFQYIYQ